MLQPIPESELIINPDGSIYHLQLKPEDIAETIITVGDPERVEEVSKRFDSIELKKHHREFITHTGYLNNKRLTVISTGMGTDNIDIFINELDALVNIDFGTRMPKPETISLDIIRLGTSGAVSEAVEIGNILISEMAIGMDGLLSYYNYENTAVETVYLEAFASFIKPHYSAVKPYITHASQDLLRKFEKQFVKGVTLTSNGFYGPQGRSLRLQPEISDFVKLIHSFRHKHFRITNFEMETAGLYGLSKLLGHNCLSVNAILANRIHQTFSTEPQKVIDKMIDEAIEIISTT